MALLLPILLPLLGFALLGLFGKRMREPLPGVMASGLVLASFLVGVGLLLSGGARFEAAWLPGIPFSLLLDPLSGLMLLIVTGVGFLIHVYAIGYMRGDPGYGRFFAYFNLFIAMMLALVLADSYPVMFIGWEGVGLASFLLIGFWYKNPQYADSARKAFIVNRIGDLGFMLGMAILWALYGTLSISGLREALEGPLRNPSLLALAGLLLFLGAIGKSAQVPLMVWLPDAMAGPTPVSALIHAATMVTAGVYLVARSSFLYSALPEVSYAIAVVGLLTALYGALSAFGQTDIKRIVAYSTISQLGYMFLAAGVGAYWVALFHVLTHAFFKALLFLASGSVIHALGGGTGRAADGGPLEAPAENPVARPDRGLGLRRPPLPLRLLLQGRHPRRHPRLPLRRGGVLPGRPPGGGPHPPVRHALVCPGLPGGGKGPPPPPRGPAGDALAQPPPGLRSGPLRLPAVSYTHLTLPTNREV